MALDWQQNTDQRENEFDDARPRDGAPSEELDDEQSVETPHKDPQEALDELGEDVSSSPAERGHVAARPIIDYRP